MKKIISIILSLVLILTVIPAENAEAATAKSWKKLYVEYLNNIDNNSDGKLIYINNDNIPELYLQVRDRDKLLTVYKGKLYEDYVGWYGNFKYMKKKNRVYYGWGKMGIYGDEVVKLSKGKLVTLGSGTMEAVDENFLDTGYFRYY